MTREEAIDIVRKNYPHVGVSGSQFETALRNLIPELRESEDERIRKELYEFIKVNSPTEDANRFIAWLEKQKEQNVPGYKTDDYFCEKCQENAFNAGKEAGLKEQKTAEWSKDDENRRDGIIQWLCEYKKEFNPKYDSLSIESIESLINWLKSLRPSWKPSEEQMKALQCSIAFMEIRKASDYDITPLKSLYEQLKKMGVEEEPEYYQHFDPDC